MKKIVRNKYECIQRENEKIHITYRHKQVILFCRLSLSHFKYNFQNNKITIKIFMAIISNAMIFLTLSCLGLNLANSIFHRL